METPFYSEGLRFSCARCSRCCRHDPGYVFLSEADLELLTRVTALERDVFIAEYCRDVEINGRRRLSLKEKPNYDCIFWEAEGCKVYAGRPYQCRSYPFWHSSLGSRLQWESLRSSCPGVGEGNLHGRDEIEDWLRGREREPLINRS